jgi:hypothetical protein
MRSIWPSLSINQPNGRAVTQPSHLPWSSGDDFRLSLTPISAGDRGSIPRGRDFFLHFFFWGLRLVYFFLVDILEFYTCLQLFFKSSTCSSVTYVWLGNACFLPWVLGVWGDIYLQCGPGTQIGCDCRLYQSECRFVSILPVS